MPKVLTIIAILAGIWTTIIGVWGFIGYSSMSTPELQEMAFWVCLALISGGIGLVAASAARLLQLPSAQTTR